MAYPGSTGYDPKQAGGGGFPLTGELLATVSVFLEMGSVAISQSVDPCVEGFTIPVKYLLFAVPPDATLFTVAFAGGGDQTGLGIEDSFAVPAPGCDWLGTQQVSLTIEDGTQAGVLIQLFVIIQANSFDCLCPG